MSGHSVPLLAKYFVQIQIGHKIFNHYMYTVEDQYCKYSCILGSDLLLQISPFTLDYGTGSLHIGNQLVPLGQSSNKATSLVSDICLIDTIEVPARCETLVYCKAPTFSNLQAHSNTVVIEPRELIYSRYNLCIACVLANVNDGEVPLSLLNPTNAPVRLYKNTRLGTAELTSSSDE